MKFLPSTLLCVFVFFYSYASLSNITLYSAGVDLSQDVAFGNKALQLWKRKCSMLSARIVTHVADESFALKTKRPTQDVQRFRQSNHQELLTRFLTAMQEKLTQLETSLEQDIAKQGLNAWYPSLVTLGLTSFVGAEWIVITPNLAKKIKDVVFKGTHELFRADKFGFNLKRQTKRHRREIKQICKSCERKFLDNFQLQLDLEHLPITWQELRERKASILRAAQSSMRDAVSDCQAKIDNFILTKDDDQNLVEAIALRVEREIIHQGMNLNGALITDYNDAREALKAQFISEIKNQSVSAAKDADKTLSLEASTANYRRGLELVESKFRLINDLATAFEKNLRSLAKTAFNPATEKSFERNKHVFNIENSGVMKGRILDYLRGQLQQVQWRHIHQLLLMSVTTPEELLAFAAVHESSKTTAETALGVSVEQLATGGISNPDWDLQFIALQNEILAVMDEKIAKLEGLLASVSKHKEKAALSMIAAHLHQLRRDVVTSFNNMIKELAQELANSPVHEFRDIFTRLHGGGRVQTLATYGATTDKISVWLTSTMRELNACLSAMNCFSTTSNRLVNLRTSLFALFPNQKGGLGDAFDNFMSQWDQNKKKVLKARNIKTVIHSIAQSEEESVRALIDAITAEIKTIKKESLSELSVTIHDIAILKKFIFYVMRVHAQNEPTLKIRKLLLRILQNEKLKIGFGAHKLYREILSDLGKGAVQEETPTFQTKEIAIEKDASSPLKLHSDFVGLPNMGNTCFANVGLQALVHISTWSQRGSIYARESRQDSPPETQEFCTTTQSLVEMIKEGNNEGIQIKLKPFFKLAYEQMPFLMGKKQGRQRDAQEFWTAALEILGIHAPDFELPVKFKSSSLIKSKKNDVVGEYTELVPMHALVLPLRPTIIEAMKEWLKPAPFEREGFSRTMFTQMMVFDPPEIMTIVVIRFNAASNKLATPMAISDLTIPFHQHKNPEGLKAVQQINYRLVGGIYHNGDTTRSGHYYFIDHTTGIVYDDKATYRIGVLDNKFIEKESYILFFKRSTR